MNSNVVNIISAIMAPEISPKVNTIFFIDSFLLTEKFSKRREDSRNRVGLSSYFWVNLPREAANHTFVGCARLRRAVIRNVASRARQHAGGVRTDRGTVMGGASVADLRNQSELFP